MKKYNLDKEELEILEEFESGKMRKSEEDLSQYMQMGKLRFPPKKSFSTRPLLDRWMAHPVSKQHTQ